MKPHPPKKLPPIRMGNRSDLVRSQRIQLEAQHQAESKTRVRIYQDVLALLDIAERLTLDLSSHEDRFGIEWDPLARQIDAQYKADVVKIVPGLHTLILSKDGAQNLPKGIYRDLLKFVDECLAFMKWARKPPGPENTPDGSTPSRKESQFMQAGKRFKQACLTMRQQICIFENERKSGEESFFG